MGTRQIKNNSITGAKLKDGAITGSKVVLSSLGTVPSATHADSASRADVAATASLAADASSLQGLSAAQIKAAAKLTCPADMTMTGGFCVDTEERVEATWVVATRTCAQAGRQLPTTSQLAVYDLALEVPEPEWTNIVDSTFKAVAFRLDKAGTVQVSQAEFGKGSIGYRCVAPAGN